MHVVSWSKEKIPDLSCSGQEIIMAWVQLKYYWQKSGWKQFFDVKRVSVRRMLIKLVAGKNTVTVLSVYAPQAGLDDSVKDLFYENL